MLSPIPMAVATEGLSLRRRNSTLKKLLAAALVLGLTGCGDAPIEVSLDTAPGLDGFSPLKYLVVTSKVDDVRLTNIKVNRGNCKTFNWRGPNPLQFGQEKRGMLTCDLDQVKEVVVETDQGEYTFTF